MNRTVPGTAHCLHCAAENSLAVVGMNCRNRHNNNNTKTNMYMSCMSSNIHDIYLDLKNSMKLFCNKIVNRHRHLWLSYSVKAFSLYIVVHCVRDAHDKRIYDREKHYTYDWPLNWCLWWYNLFSICQSSNSPLRWATRNCCYFPFFIRRFSHCFFSFLLFAAFSS